MKYLCLIYVDEAALGNLTADESAAWRQEADAYHRAFAASAGDFAATALEPSRTATTVRRRGGRIATSNGPSVDTKEQLDGVLMIEAQNLDEALKIAAGVPAARVGGVEVRPVLELSGPFRNYGMDH